MYRCPSLLRGLGLSSHSVKGVTINIAHAPPRQQLSSKHFLINTGASNSCSVNSLHLQFRSLSSGRQLLSAAAAGSTGGDASVLDVTAGGAGPDVIVPEVGGNLTQSLAETMASDPSLQYIVEPTFSSLGLAHAWPSGWAQAIMEVIHVHGGLPWWATIATTTVAIRFLLFPMVIKARRNAVKLNHITPEMQRLQVKSMQAGFSLEGAKASKELEDLFKKHGVSPFSQFPMLIVNGVIFTSMFFGLRGMANLPVESMTTGGMGWFSNLTVADPIMLLPLLTCTTLFFNIRMGTDGVDTSSMPPFMKTLLTVMPIVTFPVMMQFPAALNVYWLTTNLVSLGQTMLLKPDWVRQKLDIGEMIKWNEDDLPFSKHGGLFGTAAGGGNKSDNTPFTERIKAEIERQDELRRQERERQEAEERQEADSLAQRVENDLARNRTKERRRKKDQQQQ